MELHLKMNFAGYKKEKTRDKKIGFSPIFFMPSYIPKGIEDACRRQANEAPEHRGTM